MNDLETIIATALIGTERQSLPPISVAPDLAAESREATLLSAASLVSAYRRAGFVPKTEARTLEPSGADSKPELSGAMRDMLHRVLGHGDLLEEYLKLLGEQGVRLAHRDLPQLLNLGSGNTTYRPLITNLLDTRGRWLASLHKNWSWATGNTESLEDAVQSFETGSKSARVLALQTIRERDAHRARELLETTWKQDAAPERKEFIAVLRTNLSDADEAFLENALSDRSSDVRDIATDLLGDLPDSAFNARMRERLRPMLIVKKGKLEVELPDAFDQSWAKDGIQEKAPQSVGQKQWWVQQLMRHATLPMLEDISGMTAVDLLKNTHKDWKSFVQNAVSTALNHNPNRELVKHLIAYDITLVRGTSAFTVLEPNFLETLTTQRCFLESNTDFTLLNACLHQWSEAFWCAALEWIALQVTRLQEGKFSQYFYGFSHPVVRSTSLEFIPRVLKGHASIPGWTAMLARLDEAPDKKQKNQWYWEYTQREVKTLLETLQLRLEMHEIMK
jgi:hypothetical protein